tara:strand:- start:2848 stop:3048 length:201 start_codon:yes stop_codon:yes gene_type:complete
MRQCFCDVCDQEYHTDNPNDDGFCGDICQRIFEAAHLDRSWTEEQENTAQPVHPQIWQEIKEGEEE